MTQPVLPEFNLQNRLWCYDLLPSISKRIITSHSSSVIGNEMFGWISRGVEEHWVYKG